MATETLSRKILVPDLSRAPFFDSEYSKENRYYTFDCLCGHTIKIDLPSYIGNYKDRTTVLGQDNAERIRIHFGLRSDKSLVDGWPKFRIEQCSICEKRYLVYAAVFEPANGWYQIVMQGISEVAI